MTGPELWAALQALGWTKSEAARRLEVSRGTLRQALDGRQRVPEHVAEWVEDAVLLLDSPPRWGGRARGLP